MLTTFAEARYQHNETAD